MIPFFAFALPILAQTAVASSPPAAGKVLRLEDAVEIAIDHQPTVLQAQAQTRAAAGRTFQARSSLLPQVTGTATYQHGYGTRTTTGTPVVGIPATPAGSAGSTYDFFSLGVTATQVLWDFGQTYHRYRAADRAVASFRFSEKAAELQVVLNVRRAFFTARAQKGLIKVAEETVANDERHLAQVQGFVGVGTHPEIDLAQAKSDLANARVALITAENAYELSKSQLNQAMGVSASLDFDVADEELTAVDGEDQPTDRLFTRALAHRPELASLEQLRESQELTVKAIRGAYGPVLSAFGGASATGPGLDALGPNWNVGLTLSWPFFQGGLTTGQVREAEANVDVTRAQMEVERLQVRFDVEQAVLSLRAAKATTSASEEALVNARERLRLAEGRYTQGVGSIIELGDAQVASANAAAQVVQARFNVSIARAQLLTAMGAR